MPTECFWLEPTDEEQVVLRRYAADDDCPAGGYHNATSSSAQVRVRAEDNEGSRIDARDDHEAQADHLGLIWPTSCAACDYWFKESDKWQVRAERLYERADTGERMTIREAPPGAMWDGYWFEHLKPKNGDERVLCVKTPNGSEWVIDSSASNCTRPGEDHDCWCWHGEPPKITVDKEPNPGRSTCGAGGGSIQSGDFHGFLRGGVFTDG